MVKTVKECLELYSRLSTTRTNWESLWIDTAKYFSPSKEGITEIETYKGQRKGQHLHTSFGIKAVDEFASGMHNLLCDPTRKWFNFTVKDDDMMEEQEVKEYLDIVTETILSELTADGSNFNEKMLEVFRDIAVFGTSGLYSYLSEDEDYLRFKVHGIKELFLANDDDGKTDIMIRSFRLTSRQIINKWEKKQGATIPKAIQLKHEKDPFAEHEIIQVVYKNPNYIEGFGFEWLSKFIAVDAKEMIDQEGFISFPVAIFQWNQVDSLNEVYSRSQAQKALTDIKKLNTIEKQKIIANEKNLNPPKSLPTNYFGNRTLDLRAGALNYFNANAMHNERAVQDLVNINPTALAHTVEDIEKLESEIREMFFHEHLRVLRDPRATATQVLTLQEQGLRLMSPFSGTLQTTGLRPLLMRVFKLLEAKEILPERPEALIDQDLLITFDNSAERISEKSQLQDLDNFMQRMSIPAEVKPEILDNIDFDEITKQLAKVTNIKKDIIKEDDEVDEIREQRAEQQAQEQQMVNSERVIDSVAKVQGMEDTNAII